MKVTYRIPHPKDAYAFVEVVAEGADGKFMTPAEIRTCYDEFKTAFEAPAVEGGFEKVETFTGETILYNAEKHEYRTLDGKPLLSGSAYKKSLEKPFDIDRLAPLTAAKHGISEETIRDMWKRNSAISSGLGTALHAAMEQWFRHRGNGTEKNYHLPKHPFLRQAVETFPLKDTPNAYPEIMVSDLANGRVGQIDLFVVPRREKVGTIVDYKTDAEIGKNVEGHFHQLSFYAHILMAKGWKIEGLEVWNYTSEWSKYESPVLDLKV